MLGEEQSVHDACIACIHPVFIQDCLACGLRRVRTVVCCASFCFPLECR